VFFSLCLFLPSVSIAAPSALALLKGVEHTRLQYEPIQVEFVTQYTGDADFGARSIRTIAVVQGNKRFLEEFPVGNDSFPGCVTILNNGEVNQFRRSNASSVNRYDFTTAIRRANIVYDPRIIGLVSLPTADKTVQMCLCYKTYPDVELVGQEEVNDVNVWHVRCNRDDAHADFWVEEPSFRVHRVVIDTGQMNLKVESKFDSQSVGPFPSEVAIERFERGKQVFNRLIKISKILHGQDLSEGLFTLQSMNLPLNTDVIDYRILRRLGYWDGEKLVDDPVRISAQEHRELMAEIEKKDKMPLHRIIGIGIGIVMILLVIYLHVRSKRK
jgi:hypothetical protein